MTIESTRQDIIPIQMLRGIAASMVVFVHLDVQLKRLGYGTLDAPFAVDSDGRFDIAGSFQREGGPVGENQTAVKEPARYAGTIKNDTMTLMVTTSQPLGTFTLVRGQQGRLVKCV